MEEEEEKEVVVFCLKFERESPGSSFPTSHQVIMVPFPCIRGQKAVYDPTHGTVKKVM